MKKAEEQWHKNARSTLFIDPTEITSMVVAAVFLRTMVEEVYRSFPAYKGIFGI